jgi:FtsZ-interacting cell division protein ZipA
VEWEVDERDDRTIVWENEPEDTHRLVEPPKSSAAEEVALTPPTLDDAALNEIETADEGEISFESVDAHSPASTDAARTHAASEHEARAPEPAHDPVGNRTTPPSAARVVSLESTDHQAPIVEWPEEGRREILSLRVVSSVNRFPGRAVRQALSADGFILGKMDIFHKAGEDGRAILSAASLTRPGTFAMDTIDIQRFGGLNLFAVLPGPLSSHQAFDELVTSARTLNERLQGHLQDDTGQPLTPTRLAAIRAALPDIPAEPLPAAHESRNSEEPAAPTPEPPPS